MLMLPPLVHHELRPPPLAHHELPPPLAHRVLLPPHLAQHVLLPPPLAHKHVLLASQATRLDATCPRTRQSYASSWLLSGSRV